MALQTQNQQPFPCKLIGPICYRYAQPRGSGGAGCLPLGNGQKAHKENRQPWRAGPELFIILFPCPRIKIRGYKMNHPYGIDIEEPGARCML